MKRLVLAAADPEKARAMTGLLESIGAVVREPDPLVTIAVHPRIPSLPITCVADHHWLPGLASTAVGLGLIVDLSSNTGIQQAQQMMRMVAEKFIPVPVVVGLTGQVSPRIATLAADGLGRGLNELPVVSFDHKTSSDLVTIMATVVLLAHIRSR